MTDENAGTIRLTREIVRLRDELAEELARGAAAAGAMLAEHRADVAELRRQMFRLSDQDVERVAQRVVALLRDGRRSK